MKQRGFTMVEVVIILAVIAILATIAFVNYGGWRRNTVRKAMTADLESAAQAMEQYRNFHNKYPSLAPGASIPNYNGGPVKVYIQDADGTKFCIEATRGSEKMHINNVTRKAADNGC